MHLPSADKNIAGKRFGKQFILLSLFYEIGTHAAQAAFPICGRHPYFLGGPDGLGFRREFYGRTGALELEVQGHSHRYNDQQAQDNDQFGFITFLFAQQFFHLPRIRAASLRSGSSEEPFCEFIY